MKFGIINFNTELPGKFAVDNILSCNEQIAENELVINEEQAKSIVEAGKSSLKEQGRVEFGTETLKNLILSFRSSPYLNNDNFSDTICELINIFYDAKNETYEQISDDKMISVMKELFDGVCRGNIEFLSDALLSKQTGRTFDTVIDIAKEDENE